MKPTMIIAAVLTALCFTLQAQTNAPVNAAVTRSFNREFKSTSNVRWEKISNDVFFVIFDDPKPNSIAYFDRKGELLIKGQIVAFDKTPKPVQHGVLEAISLYEQKNKGLSVIRTYQLLENGLTKYYVTCSNNELLLSIMTSSKGKVKMVKEVKLDPTDGNAPQIISIL